MKQLLIAFLALTTFVLTTSTTYAPPKWIFLGERKVDHLVEKDVIMVTAKDGRFDSIKLKVKRNRVDFKKVVVHYGNGTKEEINLRSEIPAGGQTRAIDLKGKDRIIKKVDFYYHTERIRGKKAVVQLFGNR